VSYDIDRDSDDDDDDAPVTIGSSIPSPRLPSAYVAKLRKAAHNLYNGWRVQEAKRVLALRVELVRKRHLLEELQELVAALASNSRDSVTVWHNIRSKLEGEIDEAARDLE